MRRPELTKDGLKPAAETITGMGPKIASATGEITKPVLEKLGERLGITKPRKSLWQKPRLYIAAGLVTAFALTIKALFKPKGGDN